MMYPHIYVKVFKTGSNTELDSLYLTIYSYNILLLSAVSFLDPTLEIIQHDLIKA